MGGQCCFSSFSSHFSSEDLLIKVLKNINLSTLNYHQFKDLITKYKPVNNQEKSTTQPEATDKLDPLSYELLLSEMISHKLYLNKYYDYIRISDEILNSIEKDEKLRKYSKSDKRNWLNFGNIQNEYDLIETYLRVSDNTKRRRSMTGNTGQLKLKYDFFTYKDNFSKEETLLFDLQRSLFPEISSLSSQVYYDITIFCFSLLNKNNIYPLDIARNIIQVVYEYNTLNNKKLIMIRSSSVSNLNNVYQNNYCNDQVYNQQSQVNKQQVMNSNQSLNEILEEKEVKEEESPSNIRRNSNKKISLSINLEESISNESPIKLRREEEDSISSDSSLFQKDLLYKDKDKDSSKESDEIDMEKKDFISSGLKERLSDKLLTLKQHNLDKYMYINKSSSTIKNIEKSQEEAINQRKYISNFNTRTVSNDNLKKKNEIFVSTSNFLYFLKAYLKFNLLDLTKQYYQYIVYDRKYDYSNFKYENIRIETGFYEDLKNTYNLFFSQRLFDMYFNKVKEGLKETRSKFSSKKLSYLTGDISEELMLYFIEKNLYLFDFRSLRSDYYEFCLKNNCS